MKKNKTHSTIFITIIGNMQKKPGIPPNKVFGGTNKKMRGRGRGNGPAGQFGGTMAPVHSLSKVLMEVNPNAPVAADFSQCIIL